MLCAHRTAIVAIDCQRVFADSAYQGGPQTEAAARRMEEVFPVLRAMGIPLFSVYCNAARHQDAGLLPAVRNADLHIRKDHESGFQRCGLGRILQRAMRKTIIFAGFHLDVCVKQTALDASNLRFEAILAEDLAAEGLRKRDWNDEKMAEVVAGAHRRLRQVGVIVAPYSRIIASLQ